METRKSSGADLFVYFRNQSREMSIQLPLSRLLDKTVKEASNCSPSCKALKCGCVCIPALVADSPRVMGHVDRYGATGLAIESIQNLVVLIRCRLRRVAFSTGPSN